VSALIVDDPLDDVPNSAEATPEVMLLTKTRSAKRTASQTGRKRGVGV
jgi:hypothetical protein